MSDEQKIETEEEAEAEVEGHRHHPGNDKSDAASAAYDEEPEVEGHLFIGGYDKPAFKDEKQRHHGGI